MNLINENNLYYFKQTSLKEVKALPKGLYILEDNNVLKKTEDNFHIPDKIYGDTEETVKRYLNTFKNSDKNMGVLLTGLKGSGKSLMAKLIGQHYPCITVSKYYDNLLTFLDNINQEVVVIFDEFEKTYDTKEKQNDLLPILDGVFKSKKLFVLTANTDQLNEFILNRASRIRYHKNFEGLSLDLIEEIANDMLVNKDNLDELVEICQVLGEISTDNLVELINEMNLYGEDVRSSLKHLNIKAENHRYEVVLIVSNKRYFTDFEGHPMANEESLIHYKENDNSWWDRKEYKFCPKYFDVIFGDNGKMTFAHKENMDKIIFNKINKKKFVI
jgi:broad-specificity NMP kinase